MPQVSIIIPIYKVEQFIQRCLQSVVNQSYKDIECILVNDVSPDNSMQIVEKFIQQNADFNFKIINHKQNAGLSVARNSGIDLAHGKYLYFLDSDDEITTNAIEHLVALAEETQAELVIGESICINEKENWKRNYFPINYKDNILENNVLQEFVNGNYPVMACDKLVRKDFLVKHKLYFVKDLFSQDVLWSFQSALYLQKVAFLRETTYLYYFHDASIIHNRGKKHFENWITIAQYINQAYKLEKNEKRKKLIFRYLIEFKNTTLQMNWKAQKNQDLWKTSYKAYKKLNNLPFLEYLKTNYSIQTKKENLFTTLPTWFGFWLFRKRFER